MVVRQDEIFMQEFQKCLVFALEEFGKKSVGRWQEQLSRIMHRLKMMPESYPFVPELQKWRKYRGAIIMKNFKIIYFYNEEKDILWLVDLWDMRQDPRKLNMRARCHKETKVGKRKETEKQKCRKGKEPRHRL